MASDYYEILGIGRDASDRDVKRAFRRLARELHPDINDHDPEAEEKFKVAAEAYEVLSDPERRRLYDAHGHAGLRGGGFAAEAAFGSVEDIFQAFFGGRGFGFEFRRGPMRGQDLIHTVEISVVDAMLGTKLRVPSHDGEREIELPAGIQPGTRVALRGHGLPGSEGGPPGDLVITIAVVVPSELTEEQRRLVESLGEGLGPDNFGASGADEKGGDFFSRVRRAFG
jgi:DnaJ-class molecular chaperone